MPLTQSNLAAIADLQEVLIDEEMLTRRVAELGAQITTDYAGTRLVLVSILKGGIVFLADLMRQINLPHSIELVGSSSYQGQTTPQNRVRITKDVDDSLSGKDVLLIEDIYDSGETLRVVYELIKLQNPAGIEVCALLNKKKDRPNDLPIKYIGFDIGDVFVVGYGLDFKERYRNLPCIGVLKPEIYQDAP